MSKFTTEQQVAILQKALSKAGVYCRTNLPAEMPKDLTFFSIIAGGNSRDPNGSEFVAYFINEACDELNIEI